MIDVRTKGLADAVWPDSFSRNRRHDPGRFESGSRSNHLQRLPAEGELRARTRRPGHRYITSGRDKRQGMHPP